MNEQEVIKFVLEKLRLTWDKEDKSDEALTDVIEDCISMYKRLSNDLAKETFSREDTNWVKRACKEVVQRIDDGLIGVEEYQESGIRYKFSKDYISQELILEIFPKVGVPK